MIYTISELLKPRVSAYMHDLDTELLGIPAKTRNTEVAPCQRLAPVFDDLHVLRLTGINTMEMMSES